MKPTNNMLRIAERLRRAAWGLERGELAEPLHLVISATKAIWKEAIQSNILLNPGAAWELIRSEPKLKPGAWKEE